MANKRKPAVPDGLLDQLLDGSDALEAFQSGDLVQELKKALAERILNAELDHHLDHEEERASGNHRNGHSRKSVLTDDGRLDLSIPRDRQGRFDPKLVEKHCRRLPGFDDKVISMYARGMSTREIQGHVRELYGIEVSPELVSKVTDAVLDELAAWQSRPLESVYAIVYFDAVRVKVRDEGLVRNKAVYLAIGYTCDGFKQILGLWIEQTEGAKFWLGVMNDLKARGLADILIAVVDGLGGLSGGHRGGLPEDAGPDLHRAPDPQLDGLRLLEGAQAHRRGAEGHLPGGECRRRPGGPGGVRGGRVGPEVPRHRQGLAAAMGAGHPLLRLLGANPPGDLHHERR